MAGRGDRQEFGDALDDAEDDDEQQDRHGSSARASGARRPAKRPPLVEAAEPFVRDRAPAASA